MPGAVDANSFLQMINRRVSIRQASERSDMLEVPVAAYDMTDRRVVMVSLSAIEQVDVSGEPSYRMILDDGTVLHLSSTARVLVNRPTGATFVPLRKVRREDRVVCDSTMGWTQEHKVTDLMRWQMFFGHRVTVDGDLPVTVNRVVVSFS